ncbi:MAG: isoprenoid biosynthesis glyoxalase ElbB [Hahellaceae bacterium]|nr:isoprenoid biosynthesis glyoxalase ElbB [Hahellaceae bacterium]
MTNVAVILSGCGYLDGAEVFEAVLSLLALERRGAKYQCFAPDKPQMHVVNHVTGQVVEGAGRNVLEEAGRIVRGKIKPLSVLKAADFDALVVPGGYGAAKNLCDFAVKGSAMQVDPEVLRATREFAQEGKPAGYVCIAPAMIAAIYGKGTTCTIGTDSDTAAVLEAMGARHENCPVEGVVVDEARKVVSTPAYMLAHSPLDAEKGITRLVNQVLDWVR